ncbi:hypothetical protein LHJ74_26250 [Streptomyces sp. N2-109]|uniref:Integral membrane protein n=1 Tax=Streptomyces gossypii TaxID=2883101 RepID=A0ABT2K073_9ACTN|nr:hypothetical protein [Streptomyces gossypii]MCT2593366.1 hypothetical protein [Streptomyces gossypii]
MGWAVLYIAFGVVALWLLGEVLLQYKARLRWRLLAFGGFSVVAAGVVMLSIIVIALGTIAFAVGQTLVTHSYRRGFSTGWALGGKPGSSRRRRGERDPSPADAEPVLQVSGLETHEPYAQEPQAYEPQTYGSQTHEPQTYEPQPLPDDTGEYGVYDRGGQAPPPPPSHAPGNGGWEEQHHYASYAEPYPEYEPAHDPGQYATASFDAYGSGGVPAYDPPSGAPQPPSYAPEPPSYAPGAPAEAAVQPSEGYGTVYPTDQYAAPPEPYGNAPYPEAPYPDAPYAQPEPYPGGAQNPYPDTPPGGVWMPQQRHAGPGQLPGQGYPYQDGSNAQGYPGQGYPGEGFPVQGEGGYDGPQYDGDGYGYDTSGNGYGQQGY